MLNSKDLLILFKKKKINFFTGVPDSVLKNFLHVVSKEKKISHLVAVNEGSAVALAIGNYLNTKRVPLVYMQNSGLGNAINPIVSLADRKVYSVPMILLIGWRGSPGLKDEPQHIAKGKITKKLLSNLNIKNIVLRSKRDFTKISKLIDYSKNKLVPVAILIKNGLFKNEKKITVKKSKGLIKRSLFIIELLKNIKIKDKIISTTGYTSRELNQLRKNHQMKKGSDFYMVGGMGHTASVALGYSIKSKDKIFCLDGDGSLLMHMGSITTVSNYSKKNYRYILLNNNSHESVGGQNTNSEKIDFKKLSDSLGFAKYFLIEKPQAIKKTLLQFMKKSGPSFLEVRIKSESINNLSRPKDLEKLKKLFMR